MNCLKLFCLSLILLVVGCYPPIEHEVDGGPGLDGAAPADMHVADEGPSDANMVMPDAQIAPDAEPPMPEDSGVMPEPDAEGGAELDAEIEPDAEPQPDMTMDEPDCPGAPFVDECFFGATSNGLMNAAGVRQVGPPTTLTGLAEMDALIQQQLVYGFGCEGVTDAENAEQAVAAIDEDRVQVIEVTKLAFAQRFTWLKFYQGDTEVGFIFAQNELNLVARVSDGDIVACRVPE